MNENGNIRLLYEELKAFMDGRKWSYEAVFVDDGSSDGTAEILTALEKEDPRVKTVFLGCRQGKSAALARGFGNACGEYVVTLDGDLQDDPKEILKLWENMERTKADLVSGWKKTRHDPWHKILSSRFFNGLVRALSGVPLHDFNCGLKLYRSDVIREIPLYGELHRFIPALALWKGFSVREEPVEHRPRIHGKSKFGLGRVFPMAVDLLTIGFLTRYEGKPSHLFSGAGLLFFLSGSFITGYFFVVKVTGGTIAPRYPMLIMGITLLMLGVQFVFFGLLSEMIVYLSRRSADSRGPKR